MILVISGPPGSGKTTVAERFANLYGYELISAGALFRELAEGYGKSLEAFGRYAEEHPDIDRDLDERVVAKVLSRSKAGRDLVVDGRLQAWLLPKRRVRCFRVLVDAPLDVRAERIAGREGKSARQAKKEIQERERSERTRYASIYKVDVGDLSAFDLVVDSSRGSPDEIVAEIRRRMAAWPT